MIGLFLLLTLGLGGFTWWSLLKGKERARKAAWSTCREHGLVLMDDTVMLDSVRLKNAGQVRGWCLVYRFEFVQRGVLHRGGSVLISPGRQPTVVIKTNTGQLIQEL